MVIDSSIFYDHHRDQLHKQVSNLRNLLSMLKLCPRFHVDTLFCVKWLARLSVCTHADILVLVSEFVVVASSE